MLKFLNSAFLEDMEREYKRSTERSKEENIQVTRRDAVRNNSVREEVDVFLMEFMPAYSRTLDEACLL